MAKRFIIKDDDGKEFEVTEETIDEEPEIKKDEDPEAKPEVKDDDGLTPEEITALKALAARSTDIIKLLEVEAKEHAATDDEGEEIVDEDNMDDEDNCPGCGKPKDECICDEDEDKKETLVKTGDSKKSIGSIQKKVYKTTDSVDDRENAIAKAWADRYNKSYKKGE